MSHASAFNSQHLIAICRSVSSYTTTSKFKHLSVLGLAIAILFLEIYLRFDSPFSSQFSMLLSDWLLTLLNSCTSSRLWSIGCTGFLLSQLTVLVLILKSKLGVASKYLGDHIRSPHLLPLFAPFFRFPLLLDLSALRTGIHPLFHKLEPLWLKLDLLPPFSTLLVLALGALLNGNSCERLYIN